MRRTLIISASVVAALVALVVILPFVIPVDAYRSRIEDEASAATGRTLKINGALHLTIFPELGIEARDVTLANVPGGHAPHLATMRSLTVGVKLMPLLSGRIEVSGITLDKPVVHLEADRNGHGNWMLGRKAETAKASPAEAAGGGVARAARAHFQGLRIRDGRVHYRDDASGATRTLDNIDLTVGITSLAKPITIDGSLVTGGQTVSLDGRIAAPDALMAGRASAVDLSLTSNLLQASFKGTLARDTAEGTLKLDTPSLRRLARWAGHPLAPGGGLGRLSLEGKLTAKGKIDHFSAIRLVLDKMTLTGALALDRSAKVPFVHGALAVDRFDLNPYLAAAPAANGGGHKTGPPASGPGWSTRPIDLSVLGLMNAKLTLRTGALVLRNLKAGKTTIALALSGGVLNASLDLNGLYGGHGTARLRVDSRGRTPRFTNAAHFANLMVKPFLADTLGVDRIEGTGTVTMDVTAAGASPDAVMHALSGRGAITFKNGRVRGVDLAGVARTIRTALSGKATAKSAATDFTEMGARFAIAHGVMATKDFHLLSPFVRMTGAGDVNLGAQTMDMVVTPKAVASLEGQGGQQKLAGIGIPFRIHGPWSHLHYTPDLSGVARSVIQSIKKGGVSTKSLIQGLMGGVKQKKPASDKAPHKKKKTKKKKPSDAP
jgi:AsmA protein